jgi:hypothetical protein
MKRVIFIVLSLIVSCNIKINSQVHFEIGGGYLIKTQNGNLLTHNSNGWLISGSILYQISEKFELSSSLNYKSFLFNPNSFHYPILMVNGYPIPIVTGGDNLKSIGISFGGRLKTLGNNIVNPFLSLDFGLTYYKESYYSLRSLAEYGIRIAYESPQRYLEQNYLFESSVGMGVIISPLSSFDLILEGKLTYTHKAKELFFPISTKVRIKI